jgi:spore coat polysaccharide biosynthesis protein SpsF
MNIVAIIQARMASSRLPGKVLLDIAGRPMLAWVVERTQRAGLVNQVVVATTLDPTDDLVVDFCKEHDYPVSRGSLRDVLDRYYQTAVQFQAEVIVRITADCPLIDPGLLDEAVRLLHPGTGALPPPDKAPAPRFDFVANRLPPPWGRTYPIGLDVEVFTMDVLQQAWKLAIAPNQREHVTPYFYEGTPADQLKYKVPGSPFSSAMTPEGYHIALMHHTPDYGHLRWTVDTPEDLEVVRAIATHFGKQPFTWLDILALVHQKPELNRINAHVRHKTHLDVDDRN